MSTSLMNQTEFKRSLSSAIVQPLLVMVVLVTVSIWQVANLISATQLADHTNTVVAQARLTQKQIADMQSGLRVYYITHDPQSLQRYTRAQVTYADDARKLQRLTADNSSQQQRLAEIQTIYARWFTILNQTKTLPARDYLLKNKANTDALGEHFDAVIEEEESLGVVRAQAMRKAATDALALTVGFALILGLYQAFANRRRLLTLSDSYERSHSLLQSQAETLRASQEHLKITLQSIGDGVIATDAQGRIQVLNPVAERLTGWSQQEAQGKELEQVFVICDEATRRPAESPVTKVLREGRIVGLANHTLLLARNGREIPIDDTGAPIRDEKGELRGVVLVFHDVSERQRLENQLLQAQKLESVGRLAGGVAHDFNNLLTVILGFGELAEEECAPEPPMQDYLRNMMQAADKAANLTGQLLAFARQQVIAPKIVSLNDLMLSLDKMLRRLIGENIELVLLPAEDLHAVEVDPGQFEQILVNLIVNARDAMPDGGKITLETQNVTLDADYARQHEEVTPGEYVMVAVTDTGNGMDEAIRLHIFEPFFTTKEKGRGTGLGLATVYGIVRQAGGHIWLYSEPGKGAAFKIYLPRTAAATLPAQALAPSPELSSGSERILLVEDELAVRTLAVQALRGRGYRVQEAMNGEDALRLVQGRETEIDLLITDVIMPQMNGKELAVRLQALHSGLKVLYASGYTENTIVHHGVLEPDVEFLSKPFTPSILARKVREILDTPQTYRLL